MRVISMRRTPALNCCKQLALQVHTPQLGKVVSDEDICVQKQHTLDGQQRERLNLCPYTPSASLGKDDERDGIRIPRRSLEVLLILCRQPQIDDIHRHALLGDLHRGCQHHSGRHRVLRAGTDGDIHRRRRVDVELLAFLRQEPDAHGDRLAHDNLVPAMQNGVLAFMEQQKRVDTAFGMVDAFDGLSGPLVVVEDDQSTLPRKPPSEFCVEERVVGFMRAVDVHEIKTALGVGDFFLEQAVQPDGAELVDDAKRKARDAQVVLQLLVTRPTRSGLVQVEVVDADDFGGRGVAEGFEQKDRRASFPRTDLEGPRRMRDAGAQLDEKWCPDGFIMGEPVLGLGELELAVAGFHVCVGGGVGLLRQR
uniref:Uncharacterized protein n=1 Tax=Mycena chlorophos TaxID=658473 RepID=A0ABQ0L4I9_MYCCL|nr:predicted protein [Mycena chlorophos]